MTHPQLSILEVTVANHPGVLTRIVSLFSRRAFNVEGVVCLPLPGTSFSRLWLRLPCDARLPQLIRQLEKQEDVLSVDHNDTEQDFLDRVAQILGLQKE